MPIGQDVGRRKLGKDWDAIRDECEINQVSLNQEKVNNMSGFVRNAQGEVRTYKGHDIVRCTTNENKTFNNGQRAQRETMKLTPSSRRPRGEVLLIG